MYQLKPPRSLFMWIFDGSRVANVGLKQTAQESTFPQAEGIRSYTNH